MIEGALSGLVSGVFVGLFFVINDSIYSVTYLLLSGLSESVLNEFNLIQNQLKK